MANLFNVKESAFSIPSAAFLKQIEISASVPDSGLSIHLAPIR